MSPEWNSLKIAMNEIYEGKGVGRKEEGGKREGEKERDWQRVCDVCVRMHFRTSIYKQIWCLISSKKEERNLRTKQNYVIV